MNTTKRYERLKQEMDALHLDAMVAISPENVFYMAETFIETQKSLRDRLAIALLPMEQDPVMIACIIEENTVEAETLIDDRRYYFEFKESPIRFLADAIIQKGLANKRLGIELDYLSALYYEELRASLPDVTLIPCVATFEKLRSIKDEKEIALLTNGAQLTRKAFELAIQQSHIGDTEKMLANRTTINMIEMGCEKVDFLVMGTGARSILVHGLPDDTVMTQGELGRIDFGGLFGNYNSDIARTFTIGKATDKYKKVFYPMVEAYRGAIDACRVGAPANAPYFTAQRICKEQGLDFSRVHEGHGLGIGGHEFPILAPGTPQLFEENMVVCVEHAIHVDGYRYHVEDLVHITKDGPVILSETEFNPKLLEIL